MVDTRETTYPGRLPRWGNADLVDCDVQVAVGSVDVLAPYLDQRWRDYLSESGVRAIDPHQYPKGAPISALPGSAPATGGPPGSDLGLLRAQVLDRWQARYAVLNCGFEISAIHNDDWALAMARAVNDWQAAEWLAPEPRLRASIVIPAQNPELAAAEIDRLAEHPGFVQVLLPVRAEAPLGKRRYWPIYAAAERHGLAVGIYAGGASGNPPTPVGWPSYYLEDYVCLSQAFQAQVVSLVSEGVFTKFPALRVVLIESGFTWLPALMWRFDKNWKGLRREVPWVDRPPSEIIRHHLRLTTQPLDEPGEPRQLIETIEQLGCDEMLLFATDFPHWQFDTEEGVLPSGLRPEVEHRILATNALETYRF
ncbi:amidohydrolase family protein [Actinopolymorpha alba]|uniref:amidohydrolase family protein n=1 Tax=Actinopolymorpha alba TaxID=533267 RepID=UPI0003753D77|nr:amidohydrolase family protein [Actinopolymorpha alba]